MERSCYGVLGGMALVIGITSHSPSAWGSAVAMLAFIIFAVAFWLSLRLRAARRLFDSAGPQSFSDLKSDENKVA